MIVKHIAIQILTGIIFAASIVSVAYADNKREDIVRLIEMTGSLKLMDQMISTMLPQIVDVVRAANSSIPETLLRRRAEMEEIEIILSR